MVSFPVIISYTSSNWVNGSADLGMKLLPPSFLLMSRVTDTCENITFPNTTFSVGLNNFTGNIMLNLEDYTERHEHLPYDLDGKSQLKTVKFGFLIHSMPLVFLSKLPCLNSVSLSYLLENVKSTVFKLVTIV